MEYYSAIKKNAFESVLMRWMKLESIIQGEVIQIKMGNSGNTVSLFFWAPKSLQMVTEAMKLKGAYSLEGKL